MKRIIKYLPLLGFLMYVLLFIVAALVYDGGTQFDFSRTTFDWFHNYWCDLMIEYNFRNEPNNSRPVAIVAWIILCFSCLIYMHRVIPLFNLKKGFEKIIKICSLLAFIIGSLAFTQYHDLIVAASFPFGFVLVVGLVIGLLKSDLKVYKWTFFLPVVLLSASFYMFFTDTGLHWLGFIQKLALLATFTWLAFLYQKAYIENGVA
jgi:hypothetical protein